MASSEIPRVSETDAVSHVPEPRKTNPELLAKLVIRDGKPFITSAVEAGYAKSVATCGLKQLMRDSSLVSKAVKDEIDRAAARLDTLKPMAVTRLYHEIADYESPYGMKAIELAGRFKETDWFVRNTEMSLGVFVNLADAAPETKDLDTFKE